MNEKRKMILLEKPVDARYVRLTIPGTAQTGTTCIKEFEVYKSGSLVGIEGVSTTDSDALLISPNPVSRGTDIRLNGKGMVRFYSLQGTCVAESNVGDDFRVSTNALEAGMYVVRLNNGKNIKTGKLIVK